MLRLEAAGGTPRGKQLTYYGCVSYPESGEFSREWRYYWDRYVPERGQADTVQGEVLRVTHRLGAMYGNSGGGNWLEAPDTYDAYAELTVVVLCDGSLGEETAAFVRRTVTGLQRYCRDEGETAGGPDYSDVGRLADLALEWCKCHPYPLRREPDPRVAF